MRRDATTATLQILPTWALLGALLLAPLALVLVMSFAPADEFGDAAKVDDLGAYARSGSAERLLGWRAERSLEGGVRDALAWNARRPAVLGG